MRLQLGETAPKKCIERADGARFFQGDRVQLTNDLKDEGFLAGQIGSIKSIRHEHSQSVVIEFDDRQGASKKPRIALHAWQLEDFQLGYAVDPYSLLVPAERSFAIFKDVSQKSVEATLRKSREAPTFFLDAESSGPDLETIDKRRQLKQRPSQQTQYQNPSNGRGINL